MSFRRIILKPCGLRKDKEAIATDQTYRINQIKKLLSRNQPNYELNLSEVSLPMKPTIHEWGELEKQYPSLPIWIVIGTDLLEDEGKGRCQIQRWFRGDELFEKANFLIYPRTVKRKVIFPSNYHLIDDFDIINISSSQLRSRRQARLNPS